MAHPYASVPEPKEERASAAPRYDGDEETLQKGRDRWLRFSGRASLAVGSGTIAVVNTLTERHILKISNGWQIGLVIGLATVAFSDNLRHAVRRFVEPGREEARIRTQKTLIALLFAISQARGVDVTYLGSSVFVLRRAGLLRRKTLVRRFRFRLANHPQATDVRWTKGKGTVGACWETGRAAYRYRRSVAERYGTRDLSPAEYAQLRDNVKSGFTREEFLSMVNKYAEVLAVPIKSDQGELIGVLSVDLTADAPAGPQYLSGNAVERTVGETIGLMRDDIPRL